MFMRAISLLSALLLWAGVTVAAGPQLTDAMKAELQKEIKTIEQWVAQPEFINTVKQHNAQNLSLNDIKARDGEWIAASKAKKKHPLIDEVTSHTLSDWLRKKNQENRGRYPEAFLTGIQGENIASMKPTSDYWQGDEAKFTESYVGGKGANFIGEPEFDQSANAMQVQVSVPVKDAGQAIGVLIVGVKFSSLR
jgi:hypothetical protein